MAFLASVVLIGLLASCASAFEVTVDAYEKTCFYEDLDVGTTFSGSFEVIQGGDGTVDVQILDPNQKLIPGNEFISAPMDEFQMTAPVTGTYSVCFQNLPDSETSKDTKIVMLSVHVGVESILRNAASLKDAAVLMKELSNLRHAVMKVRDEQAFVWTRQEQQRKAAEVTNWRVLWFAFAEAVVLIGLSVWRVVSLKRFFEQKGSF